MANLPEQDLWIEGIYQIEQTDDALGGDGEEAIANRQAKQLASRTLFLKNLYQTLGTLFNNHQLAANPHPQYLLEPQIQALINAAIVPGVTARSITNLPAEDVGPIIVIEASEVWTWVNTANFTGYRSPLCGAPIAGHTITPLAHEVDAVGGIVSKAAYARLWGYAQENGLVVTQSVWTANIGAHRFVDIDGSNFRLPDLRNQFIRLAAGAPDLDTANVRGLGDKQLDALQNITGKFTGQDDGLPLAVLSTSGAFGNEPPISRTIINAGGVGGVFAIEFNFDASRVARTSIETRSQNTAMYPRIHA